jgi:hypothetical protein
MVALPETDTPRRPPQSALVWLTAGKGAAKNAQPVIHAATARPNGRANPATTPFQVGTPFALFVVVIIGEQ